ncbi:hypothetical protein SAMN04488516_11739 [Desulfonauticus submarinus]|uniref:Uncharacterized protein n=1 Tax=Desulfonauticus submarinus TaxID=206665 RepID=A0A1H0GCB2_9BACT|nr:hypothetical protein [Desulfonauticus submarinus]SDO04409.1 hypothetical protein SAMN04488516_11739 [Desulfonauticus submarinus]
MRSIVRYDCKRKNEITLFLNNKDEVIGASLFLEEPIHILDFKLEDLISVKLNKMPNNMYYESKTYAPCIGCNE